MNRSHAYFFSGLLFLFLREGTFLIGEGGPGLRRGGSSVKFLQIGKGQTCFVHSWGRVTLFSATKKITPCPFY